jgi:hypothetical protein
MIDEPGFNQRVKSEPYTETDYLGAARPSGATRGQRMGKVTLRASSCT